MNSTLPRQSPWLALHLVHCGNWLHRPAQHPDADSVSTMSSATARSIDISPEALRAATADGERDVRTGVNADGTTYAEYLPFHEDA